MRRAARLAPLVLALALASGVRGEPPEAVLDALFPGGRTHEPLARLLEAHPLEPGRDFQAHEIARDARSSHHLVWIADRETPHRHDRHDLLVVILRGFGGMRIGDEERLLGEGSVLWVPRGTVHAFRNASGVPAAAYAVYFPPFDGTDRAETR